MNIDDTIARLTDLEKEREELLASLRAAHAATGEVLSCFGAAPAPPPPKAAPVKTSVPRKARSPNVTDGEIAAAVEAVSKGDVHKVHPAHLAAAKRKGLVVCTGRGKSATYAVA